MKTPLLLSITGITLVALTATTLYAQTTTGNSVISKMKAAVSAFTLTGDLNPGQTGLQSAPVSGKKTGDILTAGEWNRVLELVSEGGHGGALSSCEVVSSPLGQESKAFCGAEQVRTGGGCKNDPNGAFMWRNYPIIGNDGRQGWFCSSGSTGTLTEAHAVCCSRSAASSGSGWVDVPLTGTENFDNSCMYRLLTSGGIPSSYAGTNYWVYPITVSSQHIVINADSGSVGHIYSASKNVYRVDGAQALVVQKMQKLCGGGGGSGSGWTSTCPTGMSLVGTAGTRNAFCIETNLRTGTIYHNAAENCRTAGRSLCTYEQWTNACLDQASTNRKPIPALVGVHSSREWILGAQTWSGGTYQGGMVIGHLTNSGSPSCLNSSALDDDVEAVAATVKYRCCSY